MGALSFIRILHVTLIYSAVFLKNIFKSWEVITPLKGFPVTFNFKQLKHLTFTDGERETRYMYEDARSQNRDFKL